LDVPALGNPGSATENEAACRKPYPNPIAKISPLKRKPGRPKGSQNRVSRDAKELLAAVRLLLSIDF
jgi:hypothetical protein